jgi:hypothetical protein
MQISVDGWSWIGLDELGAVNADVIRRKLTLVESIKRSAFTHRAFREDGNLIGVPRSFFRASVTVDHDVVFKASNGLKWPDRVKAGPGDPWATAQDGDVDELVLADAFTGERSEDFFSKNQKTGISEILKILGGSAVADGMAIFTSEHAAAKVCLSLIKVLKMRTLVLTPPGAPLAMWRTVAGRYLPDAKIGTLRRGERDVPDAHITISTIEDANDFITHDKLTSGEFGFVISHQVHKMDPMAWVRVVPFFSAAKRLGIVSPEASFNTGLSRVYRYHLGEPIFCADPDLETPKIRRVWSTWKISNWAKVNPSFVSRETLLDHMVTSTVYNQQLVEQVVLALVANRKIVVTSERVPHLKTLKMQIEAAWSGATKVVDIMTHGMSSDDIAKAAEANVILTTYAYVKSAPEMPEVDTVVLASPVRDPLPSVRLCISRHESKKPPVVVDMRCDDIPVCKDYGKSRDDAYRSSFGSSNG